MSKAARGAKRLCESCEAKFYDLNRSPIICPLCQTEFKLAKSADDDKPPEAEKVVVEPTPVAQPAASTDDEAKDLDVDPELAAVDDEDLAGLDDVETDDADDDTDTFLPTTDDDDGEDVSELISETVPNKVNDDN